MVREKFKIYLFRHGKTTFNRDGRFTGWMNSKLTAEGKKHAKGIAKQLRDKTFEVAIHTHLSRSKDTLKPTLKQHPECKIILEDDRMIERGYGELQGMTHDAFIKKNGKAKYDLIHRGYDAAAKGGESFANVEKRVRSFIKDLKKFMKKEKVSVAISAHGNSIRLFRKVMEKASRKDTVSWTIPYDKVFEYDV